MTIYEAHLILSLPSSAPREDICAAHRKLIKRLHPDGGGSSYLASQINQAKPLLLKQAKAQT
jgi:curved DNA-binding protein CbpA